MKRAHFIGPARREFLLEVAYYNGQERGLGARFADAVQEATVRALAFPYSGSPASKNTRRVFVKDFPFAPWPMYSCLREEIVADAKEGDRAGDEATGEVSFRTADAPVVAIG